MKLQNTSNCKTSLVAFWGDVHYEMRVSNYGKGLIDIVTMGTNIVTMGTN